MSENREYFCFKFFVYYCVHARNAILRNLSFHAQEAPSISKSRHVPALGKDALPFLSFWLFLPHAPEAFSGQAAFYRRE